MNYRPAPYFVPFFLAACVLSSLLFLGSCDSEPPTVCPTTGLGVLEGYLRIEGQGISEQIGAYALEGPTPGRVSHITVSDSTGWYRLELPTGLYRLVVDPYSSSSSSSDYYDSIRVLPRVFRFDIKRGGAEIRLNTPAEWEGQSFSLRLRDREDESIGMSTLVENGLLVFDFPCLVPNYYTMTLQGGHLESTYYLPGFSNESDADILQVERSSATIYEADFRESYASITGSITGSWQNTGSSYSPSVHVVNPDSTRTGRGAMQSDGTFVCGFLEPRKVILRSEFWGIVQWIGGDSFETATVFDLQPGDRLAAAPLVESGIQLQLEGPGDLINHRPYFTLIEESGPTHHPVFFSGNPYSICNLRPGRYFLKVDGFCEEEPWAPQWYGGSELVEGALAIDLAEGELLSIVMELEEGGAIEGTLTRTDGTLPRVVQFGLFDSEVEQMCSGWRQWRSFDEGAFRFRGLANGEYYLGVLVDNGETWWYPGTADIAESVPLTIENHAALADVDWKLP